MIDPLTAIERAEFCQFYGFDNRYGNDYEFEKAYRLAGQHGVRKCVVNFSKIFGVQMRKLYVAATRRNKGLSAFKFEVLTGLMGNESDGIEMHQNSTIINVPRSTTEILWPQDYTLRYWTITILYLSGFEILNAREESNSLMPGDILPNIFKPACTVTCNGRLEEPGVKTWLDERHVFIKKV